MPRKLTNIRRSIHKTMIHLGRVQRFIKQVPPGAFMHNILLNEINLYKKNLNTYRDQEAEYINKDPATVKEAYPMRGIKITVNA